MTYRSLKFLSLRGEKLYIQEIGKGMPMLLLHAGVAEGRMWEPQIKEFGREYHLIVPDLRGFGQSPLPDGLFSYHGDIEGLINELQLVEVWLVGTSFGARVAMDFALTHPDEVKGLILVSSVFGGLPLGEDIKAFNQEEELLLEAEDFHAATELNMRMWVDGPYRSPSEVDADLRTQVAEMQFQAFKVPEPKNVKVEGLDPPAGARLKEIKMPVLIIVGKLDTETILHQARLIADEIDNSRLELAPDAAHMLSMEKPDWFNDLVREFIQEVEAGE